MPVEIINNGIPVGRAPVAERLLATHGDPNSLRTGSVLQRDQWKVLDTAVIKAFRSRIPGVSDLMSRGLRHDPGTGLASTILEGSKQTDMDEAAVAMDPRVGVDNDTVQSVADYLPLPVVYKGFRLGVRQLAISRLKGFTGLDVSNGEAAGRSVSETLEGLLFNGWDTKFGGQSLYGYLNFPSVNTYALPMAWDNALITGELILTDILEMIQACYDARRFGPYMCYIPQNYERPLGNDFKAASDKSLRSRLLEASGLLDIKVSNALTGKEKIVLAEMDTETVRMIEAVPVTTVQWDSLGGMQSDFLVMTVNTPQIRADAQGRCGVTIGAA